MTAAKGYRIPRLHALERDGDVILFNTDHVLPSA